MTQPLITLFLHLVISMHAPNNCRMPQIVFDTDKIVNVCQPKAKPGNRSPGCYSPSRETIWLRSNWDADRDDMDVAEYELRRHITEACLHKAFNPENEDMRIVLERQRALP